MKSLVVEDDMVCREVLVGILQEFGPTQAVENGVEAVEAVRTAIESGEYYDLICLDIMMPEMDGQQALREIRAIEEQSVLEPSGPAKIFMTSSVSDRDNVMAAVKGKCSYFLVKPIEKTRLIQELRRQKLIAEPDEA